MSSRHNRYRSRSREPATSGQHVEVFAPLPSIHAQHRQQRQTGSRPHFGVSNAETSSHFRAPAKERCRQHVNEIDQATLIAANLSIPQPRSPRKSVPIRERILKDNRRSVGPQKRGRSAARVDDEAPEKRGRGRPRKDQSIPPNYSSSSRRSINRDSGPSTYYSDRNRTPDIPQVRNARRSGGGGHQTEAPLRRARNHDAENREPYASATRERSRQPVYDDEAPVRESRRSVGRQPRNQPPKTRRSTSVEIISTPPPEQPSSSNARRSNVRASESPIASNAEERILENKAPCIAEMAVILYNQRLESNRSATFAPNIFAHSEILNNCNGGNHIGLIVDTLRRYTDRHR